MGHKSIGPFQGPPECLDEFPFPKFVYRDRELANLLRPVMRLQATSNWAGASTKTMCERTYRRLKFMLALRDRVLRTPPFRAYVHSDSYHWDPASAIAQVAWVSARVLRGWGGQTHLEIDEVAVPEVVATLGEIQSVFDWDCLYPAGRVAFHYAEAVRRTIAAVGLTGWPMFSATYSESPSGAPPYQVSAPHPAHERQESLEAGR